MCLASFESIFPALKVPLGPNEDSLVDGILRIYLLTYIPSC